MKPRETFKTAEDRQLRSRWNIQCLKASEKHSRSDFVGFCVAQSTSLDPCVNPRILGALSGVLEPASKQSYGRTWRDLKLTLY